MNENLQRKLTDFKIKKKYWSIFFWKTFMKETFKMKVCFLYFTET